MPFIRDASMDALLSDIDGALTVLHITSTETTLFANIATNTLGNKGTPATTGPQDYAGGRELQIDAITDGNVTADGTADSWALVSGSAVLAAGQLSGSQVVTNGNTFTLTQFNIQVPDAV